MKKVIHFFKYNESMLKAYKNIVIVLLSITGIGLACGMPIFFMDYHTYEKSLFYSGMEYGLSPIFAYFYTGLFWGPVVMWYGAAKNREATMILRIVAIFMSVFAGGILFIKFIQPYTHYTYTGFWNIVLFLSIGFVYTLVGSSIVKKPFDYIESV